MFTFIIVPLVLCYADAGKLTPLSVWTFNQKSVRQSVLYIVTVPVKLLERQVRWLLGGKNTEPPKVVTLMLAT